MSIVVTLGDLILFVLFVVLAWATILTALTYIYITEKDKKHGRKKKKPEEKTEEVNDEIK